MSYLTADDVSGAARRAMLKLADWDEVEGTWSIHVPLPESVTIELDADESFLDVSLELHNLLEQNGVTFNVMSTGGKPGHQLTIVGLELE